MKSLKLKVSAEFAHSPTRALALAHPLTLTHGPTTMTLCVRTLGTHAWKSTDEKSPPKRAWFKWFWSRDCFAWILLTFPLGLLPIFCDLDSSTYAEVHVNDNNLAFWFPLKLTLGFPLGLVGFTCRALFQWNPRGNQGKGLIFPPRILSIQACGLEQGLC